MITIGQQLGSYEIIALLGKGGMGEVYRAHDTKLGRDVALKVLPRELVNEPERRSRLLSEARAAASLNHPNICTIHEIGEAEGEAYIAMEVVEGKTLSTRLVDGPADLGCSSLWAAARRSAGACAQSRYRPP